MADNENVNPELETLKSSDEGNEIKSNDSIVDELLNGPADNDEPTEIVDDIELKIDMDETDSKPHNINTPQIGNRGSTLRIFNVEMNLANYFASKTFDSMVQVPQIQSNIDNDAPTDFEAYRQNTMKNIKNTFSTDGTQTDKNNNESEKEKTDYTIKLKVCAEWCCSALIVFCMRVLMPIFALLYATLYNNESVCNDGTDYLIKPKAFLYALAIVDLIMFLLYFLNLFATGCGKNDAPEKWKHTYTFLKFLYFVFLIAAALAGCYVFNQMSDECRKEDIAIMVLVYSIKILAFNLCCTISFHAYKILNKPEKK
eukprot:339526_1